MTTAPQGVDLAILVRPVLGDDRRLELEIRARSDDLPRRFVVQKRWAGEEEVLDDLDAPRLECDGREVSSTAEDLETHVGWATPSRCKTTVVRYAIRPAKRELAWGWEFDVVVTPELATAIAETALILPDVPDETTARVQVTFDLAAMPGAEGVYSLGPGVHETTTRALRHAYFAMGQFDTIRHTAGNLSLEARFPVGTPDLASASRDLFRLLDAEAKVFDDGHDETIRLLVVGMPKGGGAHGTSLTSSAILWRQRSATWTADDARLAAHEMFHLYNGQIIERSSGPGTDAQTYWFSEGFTEHYTDELMRRSGVFGATDWLASVRDRLRRYHRHPDCEAPNDSADMRWGGSAVQLPYLRGSLVAAYVDRALRDRTHGARSLDDFMRTLLSRARAHAPPIDTQEMLRLIAGELGDEAGALVRDVALRGKRLELPADTFGSCVEVVGTGHEQDVQVRPGVDLESCLRAGG